MPTALEVIGEKRNIYISTSTSTHHKTKLLTNNKPRKSMISGLEQAEASQKPKVNLGGQAQPHESTFSLSLTELEIPSSAPAGTSAVSVLRLGLFGQIQLQARQLAPLRKSIPSITAGCSSWGFIRLYSTEEPVKSLCTPLMKHGTSG